MPSETADGSHLARFAADLRELHDRAGRPDYRQLCERTHFGRTVLSAALNGNRLPSWPVTRALVEALGGDPEQWRERWGSVAHALRGEGDPGEATDSPLEPSAPAPPANPGVAAAAVPTTRRSSFGRRWWAWVAAALAVTLLALAGLMTITGWGDPAAPPALPTDPGAGIVGGWCMRVIALRDVRVFTAPEGDELWTQWGRDTRFWIDPGAGTLKRYRTVLRNGRHGWVGTDARYVAAADGCP